MLRGVPGGNVASSVPCRLMVLVVHDPWRAG